MGGAADVVPLPPARPATLVERARMRLGQGWLQQRIIADRIARAAREAVRRHGIEVLVMEETWGWAAEVQRALPIPVVVTLHGPWFLLHELLSSGPASPTDRVRIRREAAALGICAGVTAPSAEVLRATLAACDAPGALPRAVIPNPMPVAEPLDYGSLDETARRSLLFVGRFDALEGADTVLDAFVQLIRGGAEARLTFVGPDRGIPLPGGGMRHAAEALAALPEDVRSRIDYLGPLSKGEIEALRRRHAIAIMASRYENFPYALLEALAAGTATVCTAVGGAIEAVRDGETMLIPPGDPDALADALRRLLDSPEMMRRLGAAARASVETTYAPAPVADRMTNFLARVTETFRGADAGKAA